MPAISIKTISNGEPVSLPASVTLAAELDKAVSQAVTLASDMAEKKAAAMLDQVRAITSSMQADVVSSLTDALQAKQAILSVEIDGTIRPLTHQASPYLGRCLVHAKLAELTGDTNTMLVGPAGCGKTTIAAQVAESLGRDFGHISLEPGTSITALFGRQTAMGFSVGEKCFFSLYKNGGVFLLDEMDNADGSLLTAINTAIANGELYNTITGEIAKRHKHFYLIAGCNTHGKGGDEVYQRNRLDGATLNRFITIEVDYNPDVEKMLCPDKDLRAHLLSVRKKLSTMRSNEILGTRNLKNVYIENQAGIPLSACLRSVCASWPDELIKNTGIMDYKPSVKTSSAEPEPVVSASNSVEPSVEPVKTPSGNIVKPKDESKRCASCGHLWHRHEKPGQKCWCGCADYHAKGV